VDNDITIIQGERALQEVRKGQAVLLDNHEDPGQVVLLSHRCNPLTWNIQNFTGRPGEALQWAIEEHQNLIRQGEMGLDTVVFPVGVIGLGYPSRTAFQVPGDCMACDKTFNKWFMWRPRAGVLAGAALARRRA